MIRFPEILPGGEIVVSATMYLTYLRCPDQALARHGGAYPVDSRTSFRGGLAHSVFARHLTEGEIPGGGFDQACREEIGSGQLNHKVGSLGLRPSELAGVIREVGEMYERFKRFPRDGFVAAEVFIEAEPSPGVILRGSIDAVFDVSGTRLVDWKTGQLGQSQEQLWFYAMLWALDRGELPEAIEAVSVSTGERWDAIPRLREVERTVGRVSELVAALRSAAASGTNLTKRAGSWCRYCPVLDDCDEGRSAAKVFSA